MGGNVFSGTVRKTTQDLIGIVLEWSSLLSRFSITFAIPENISEKEDHGDLDILVVSGTNLQSFVKDYLDVEGIEYKLNGDVYSILYKDFQVDLIKTTEEDIEFSEFYFSYNDLGNLLGRMSKQLGFTLKHNGLYYKQQDGSHVLKEHLLTKDYQEVLKILGVDVYTYLSGMHTYEDMFKFVSSSPYFNSDIFQYESLNNKNRVRDRKRKTYNLFLEWCSKQTFLRALPKLTYQEKEDFVCSHFPYLRKELDNEFTKYLLKLSIKQKFNGSLVMEVIPELSGKNLGSFISKYKEHFAEDFQYFIVTSTLEDIKENILHFYKGHGFEYLS